MVCKMSYASLHAEKCMQNVKKKSFILVFLIHKNGKNCLHKLNFSVFSVKSLCLFSRDGACIIYGQNSPNTCSG